MPPALGAAHRALAAGSGWQVPGSGQAFPVIRRQLGGNLAVRAEGAQQALGHDPDQGGLDQVMGHAQFQQSADGAGGVVGVQGRQHQVPGKCGLDGHFRSLKVTDLADHDDVGVLAHQCTYAAGKTQVDIVLDLHLVERRFDHLDRVLDGAQVDLGGRELLQGGVEGAGLARAGGPGDQDDAVGLGGHGLPAAQVIATKAQLVEILEQDLGIEDAHHQLFTERRGQGREPQLDFTAVGGARLDPAILGLALFRDVHAPQALEAADDGQGDLGRELVDVV